MTDDKDESHGSCVASKVAGTINGVCKHAELVVVKTTLYGGDLVGSFNMVLEEIPRNDRPSVVVFAGNSKLPIGAHWPRIRTIIGKMFEDGAVVVVNSGNHAARSREVDTVPSLWEGGDFPLIVAGSVNTAGRESDWSQKGRHVTIWAPGEGIRCAKNGDFRYPEGTSYSAGTVSS